MSKNSDRDQHVDINLKKRKRQSDEEKIVDVDEDSIDPKRRSLNAVDDHTVKLQGVLDGQTIHLHIHIKKDDPIHQINIQLENGLVGNLSVVDESPKPPSIPSSSSSRGFFTNGFSFGGVSIGRSYISGSNTVVNCNNGNISVSTSNSASSSNISLTIVGNVQGRVENVVGDVTCMGDVHGDVKTTSGDVVCEQNVKSVATASGDVSIHGNAKNVSTVSGDVTVKENIGGSVSTISGSIKSGSNRR